MFLVYTCACQSQMTWKRCTECHFVFYIVLGNHIYIVGAILDVNIFDILCHVCHNDDRVVLFVTVHRMHLRMYLDFRDIQLLILLLYGQCVYLPILLLFRCTCIPWCLPCDCLWHVPVYTCNDRDHASFYRVQTYALEQKVTSRLFVKC